MAKAKRRLTNIRVKEVSLVDEAANLRRFIVVKRKGGPIMGKKNAELLKDDESVIKLSAEVKETLTGRGKEVIEKMTALLATVEGFEVSEDADGDVPGDLIEKFDEVAQALPNFDDEDEDFGIAKAVAEIKKAGKKISGGRLEKISEAFNILSGLLEELGHTSSASTEKTASTSTSHEGGSTMANKEEETTKRSPEVAFTLAEAEVIKAREALDAADESADAEAIKKAKEAFAKAEEDFKVAKEAKDEANKASEVAKAQKVADDAAAELKKAKGESDEPEGENASVLKQILAGQAATQEKIDAVVAENAELKKKLDVVAKTAQPSNAEGDNADEDENVDKNADGDKDTIEKGKADKEFWGGVFS